jgi:hypothetical protein
LRRRVCPMSRRIDFFTFLKYMGIALSLLGLLFIIKPSMIIVMALGFFFLSIYYLADMSYTRSLMFITGITIISLALYIIGDAYHSLLTMFLLFFLLVINLWTEETKTRSIERKKS